MNRPVLVAPLEFLQAKTKLAPDQVAKHFVIMIGMVKCEKNLLRKPQRLAHDRPLENARPGKPLRQPVQTVAHGHAGVVSIPRRPTDGGLAGVVGEYRSHAVEIVSVRRINRPFGDQLEQQKIFGNDQRPVRPARPADIVAHTLQGRVHSSTINHRFCQFSPGQILIL